MEDGDQTDTPTHVALERFGLALLALYVIFALVNSPEDAAFFGIAGLVVAGLGLVGRMMRESRD